MTQIRKCIHSFAWWLYNFTREDQPPDSSLMIEIRVDADNAISALSKMGDEVKKFSDQVKELSDRLDEMQKKRDWYPMSRKIND